MCSDVAISVRDLTKTYRMFEHSGDRIKEALTLGGKQFHKKFTALKDVSFEIKKGEIVGVIGRNGSGKSTLLQLICGILKPTTGAIVANGRISALLELGAGFNPEFTGRENVYFQGAVLGISKDEMARRFDGIAAFADIGDFIDAPVGTYSSGMFARLAFAVGSSVDAEIILIDEAMAVGDVAFQARCLSRIRQLKAQGTTFLLVSHSTAQILNNADSALLLDSGSMVMHSSSVSAVISAYEARTRNTAVCAANQSAAGADATTSGERLAATAKGETRQDLHESRFGSFEAIVRRIDVIQDGSERTCLLPGKNTLLRFHVDSSRPFADVVLALSMRLPGSGDLWGDNNLLAERPLALHAGRNLIEFSFDFPLSSGEYLVHCGLAAFEAGSRVELDQRWPAAQITVISDRAQVGHVHAPITVRVLA